MQTIMRGKILRDWSKFNWGSYGSKEDRKKLQEALQFFWALPDKFVPSRFSGNDAVSKKFQEKRKEH